MSDVGADLEGSFEESSEEIFLKSLAITFCDWMNVKNIPYSTCNSIIKEVFNSYGLAKEQVLIKLFEVLSKEGISEDKIKCIIDDVGKGDPFELAKAELLSESSRLYFLKTNFSYTEPQTVRLPVEKGEREESYQYVPIRDSLRTMLEDDSFIKQRANDSYFHEPGLYKDVRDGTFFRNNKFFRENPDSVALLMFQARLY